MDEVPLPVDEGARLAALHDLAILDTPPEFAFDELARLAATVADAPIALVSLVDRDRQWFKSACGIQVAQTPRAVSFCAHAIGDRKPLVVVDAAADRRFANNPLVTGEPGIRFYAGFPLFVRGSHAVGTLCVIDRKCRSLSARQMRLLAALAREAEAQLELSAAANDSPTPSPDPSSTRSHGQDATGVVAVLGSELGSELGAEPMIDGEPPAAAPVPQPRPDVEASLVRERDAVQRLVDERDKALRGLRQLQQMVVHDLKTPVTAILIHAEMLLDLASPGSPGAEHVSEILESVSAMQRAILDLLEISRGDGGGLRVRRLRCDVSALVGDVCRRFAIVARRKEQRVEFASALNDRDLLVDRDLIARVLQNLLDNAHKYGPKRSVLRVEISEEQGAVCIRVIDQGRGVPKTLRDKVFEPYVRLAEDGDSAAGSSFGIGLTFCREAVLAHQGRIYVEESSGASGSCFCVLLPKLSARRGPIGLDAG